MGSKPILIVFLVFLSLFPVTGKRDLASFCETPRCLCLCSFLIVIHGFNSNLLTSQKQFFEHIPENILQFWQSDKIELIPRS